jgi:transposase
MPKKALTKDQAGAIRYAYKNHNPRPTIKQLAHLFKAGTSTIKRVLAETGAYDEKKEGVAAYHGGRKKLLSDEEVEHIREWYYRRDETTVNMPELAKLFGVSSTTISNVINKKGVYGEFDLEKPAKNTKI